MFSAHLLLELQDCRACVWNTGRFLHSTVNWIETCGIAILSVRNPPCGRRWRSTTLSRVDYGMTGRCFVGGAPSSRPCWASWSVSAACMSAILERSVITSGVPTRTRIVVSHPEWEKVMSAAASVHFGHRFSHDADHVLTDLRERFDQVLADLESIAGWQAARVRPPVLILGSLGGIETGIRRLMHSRPLETVEMPCRGGGVVVPTLEETLRIKAVLILKRNVLRDYTRNHQFALGGWHDPRNGPSIPETGGRNRMQAMACPETS